MPRRRFWWIVGFLTVTATAIGMELIAAFDSDPATVPWTDLLGRYVPWPVTALAVAALVIWLPLHLAHRYRHPPQEGIMTDPTIVSTQARHPWRATVRTVVAAGVALLSLLPTIAAVAHLDTVPAVAQVLAVAGAVTRVLAIPGVDGWLRRWVPWLAASPSQPG